MGLLHRSGVCALALAAGSAALLLEPAVIRDIAFDSGSRRIAVGAVRVPLWSAAFAQSASSFSLENVSFTLGATTYEAKRIEFSGVTSARAEIEELFSPASTEPMMARLARVNAKRIAIPEARTQQRLGGETQTTFYRNVVLSDVVAGRAASLTVEATGVETAGPQGTLLISGGRTTISDLDMGALAGLYETKAETASAPMTRIYGAFSIDGLELTDSEAELSIKVARMSGRDFQARPTKESWAGTETLLAELADRDDLSPDDTSRVLAVLADMLDAFDISLIEAAGIEFKAPSTNGDGNSSGSHVTGRINRVAYSSGSGSRPADLRMEGMEIAEPDSRVKVDAIGLTGFSLTPTLNGLRALQGRSLEDLDHATIRTLIPTLGTLRVSGVDIDALSKGNDGQEPERTRLGVEVLEITAEKPLNGIPTNIRFEQRNGAMSLPSNSADKFINELRSLGYEALTTSFLVEATWNEATNEITLKEASIQGQDMGRISVTGIIGNVTKDLFSADKAAATVALIGAKAKSAEIVIEDKGLFERYLAKAAKEQQTTPEALRKRYAGIAALIAVPSLIGDSEQASTIGQAIEKFISQPGKLTINAVPKNPSGFGMADVMLAPDPKQAIKKLNITAKVE